MKLMVKNKKNSFKNKNEKEFYITIPDYFYKYTESKKQQLILLNIWIRFVNFKQFAPENRKKHILGDFFKLTNLLQDPMDLVSIPYVQSKKLAYGMSVSRMRLAFLILPRASWIF